MAMMSIVTGIQEYIQAMVDRIPGMKVLILDAETIGMISMVFSLSDLLNSEVYLYEKITEQREKMSHLNAVCFLRPTNSNFYALCQELRAPKYNEYHIFFTNAVPHVMLEKLASNDENEVVHQVQEFYADVYAVTHDLFSLNQASTIRLTEDKWTEYEDTVFQRMIEGLLSVCLTLRMLPEIRYTKSSKLTQQVAHHLSKRLKEEMSLFQDILRESKKSGEAAPVLLLLDRKNDPVTPLLNQWTYQAMLHEVLGMENNRINMSRVPDIRPELKEIVMSITQDQFFEENLTQNFGDLGVNIKKYVEDYQRQTKNTARIESIEEMQRFVDEYPEFRRMSGNVSKHVAVVHELSRTIEAHGLLAASQLEQELACSESRQEHHRAVLEMLRGNTIMNMERLRLVLLYALRYENDVSGLAKLKEQLRVAGLQEEQIALIDQLLQYAGSHARSGDLFQNKTLLAQTRSVVAKNFKGVENVYTQHKTQTIKVVEDLLKGKLKEGTYPFADPVNNARDPVSRANSAKDPVQRAVVFIVGGTTFEESRDVSELNKGEGGRCVILGGTTVHNSRSFLADVAQLNMMDRGRGGPE